MKLHFTQVFTLFCCLLPSFSFAQELKPCYTSEMNAYYEKKYPEALKAKAALEEYTRNFSSQKSAVVYIVPVVFHIIHQYGTENISDAQVQDAMSILNRDFRKQNADTANVVAAFQGIIADVEIEFRLAKIDPDGNCTNGIDRIYSDLTVDADDDSKLNPWPRNKYLNIWVVKNVGSGAAAYSMYPSSVNGFWGASVDGVLANHSYIGSIGTGSVSRSRTLTHEVGHWLNLAHCWGDSNSPGVTSNCNDDDNVSDTPNTIGWTSCNLGGASCGSALDNVQNYMEYSYCTAMFTNGQRSRMRAALTSNTAQRSNLWTSSNLNATGVNNPTVVCAPIADFYPASDQTCAGQSIAFNDASFNGTPTSWNWSFSGGTPATSTLQNPVVTYNTPGIYSVTLTVSNAAGSDNLTKYSEITVLNAQAAVTGGSYNESFENINLASGPITLQNSGSGWALATNAGYSGTKSIYLNVLGNNPGEKDAFMLPGMDITQFTNPVLYYRVAYAQLPNSTANLNTLRIYTSDNCGASWFLKKTTAGSALATVPAQTATYVPSATSHWRQEYINLWSFANDQNLIVKFEFTSEDGNRIYLDDININQPSADIALEALASGMTIYPNPSNGAFSLSFNLPEQNNVQVNILDVAGNQVHQLHNGNLSKGEQIMDANLNLSKGIYFVECSLSGYRFSRKLIIH